MSGVKTKRIIFKQDTFERLDDISVNVWAAYNLQCISIIMHGDYVNVFNMFQK
jgi:hypothetical protein